MYNPTDQHQMSDVSLWTVFVIQSDKKNPLILKIS